MLAAPRLALPIIATTGVLLFIVNLGGYPLYTKGEPREAVTVFDIVNGSGIILPMRAGVEIPSKPLLMHWLAALVSILCGQVNEWTVRMPSAVFAIFGMVICYAYIRRLFEERAALLSALMLGTCFQYLQAGTGARVDMTLTFFIELAFFEFIAIAEGLTTRTTLLYFAMALAVLTKGPIGVLLPVLVAGIWIVLWRRSDLNPRLRLARGAVIVGILGGGWYLAAIVVGGLDFIHKQILAENLYRLFHNEGFHQGHAHPFYYEDAALIVGFLPWSPVALAALLQYFRGTRRLDPRFGYLLTWFLTVLIFYNLPQSKRGAYLLALYPALSAMVALLVCDALDSPPTIAYWVGGLSRAAGAFFLITGIGGLAGVALLHRWPEAIGSILAFFGITATDLPAALATAAKNERLLSLLVPVAVAAIGILLLRSRPAAEKMVAAVAAGFVCITLAVNLVAEPATANAFSLKDFAARTSEIADGRSIGYLGGLDYAFIFYSGRSVNLVSPRTVRLPEFIVSPEHDWELAPADLRDRFMTILRSNPTDPDGTGRMLLLRRADGNSKGWSI
jgi:4-amino-4-deoxy-L-arabinose transferase-like glycosyltransferase